MFCKEPNITLRRWPDVLAGNSKYISREYKWLTLSRQVNNYYIFCHIQSEWPVKQCTFHLLYRPVSVPVVSQQLLYASSLDSLTVWWSGYTDPESDIKDFKIRLLTGPSCFSHNDLTTLVDWTELSPNSTSYEFTHLTLQVSNVIGWTELS